MARRPAATLPRYKRRRRDNRSWPRRIFGWTVRLVLVFLIGSVLWVLAYRFVPPPITVTMIGDVLSGRGLTKDWMPISRIDRDMVRAAIAAEDSKFCQHAGFDWDAISAAAQRNASGGRIRGGSTISQQTAKNAFLWQGGGYFRKGLEAWFTLLVETMWDKRRIMEVYLNIAETGIGTYGVNAGAQRYFSHDSSALSRTEAARIAAVLPLPKDREAVTPRGFTRRYGNTIAARIGVVARDGLDACVYRDIAPPEEKAPPPASEPSELPGEEYESPQPLPPLENAVETLPATNELAAEPQSNESEPAEPVDTPDTPLITPPPAPPPSEPTPPPPPQPVGED
jgi:monofunctional biosynthetic peptidoglycan transglycosylase